LPVLGVFGNLNGQSEKKHFLDEFIASQHDKSSHPKMASQVDVDFEIPL